MWCSSRGILSPYLFSLCLNDVVKYVESCAFGCHIGIRNISIIMYADDILLLAPSLYALQKLLHIVESYLVSIDMSLNAKKSVCLRIGPQYRDECAAIATSGSGDFLRWVTSLRYLGVVIQSGKRFKVSISENKKSFYRAANTIYSKIGRSASEEVTCKLIDTKCVTALLYGLEATPKNLTVNRSLDFICVRNCMRLFKTRSVDIIHECCNMMNIRMYSERLHSRKHRTNNITKFMVVKLIFCVSLSIRLTACANYSLIVQELMHN